MKTFTFLVNANDKHCFVHQYQSEMPTNDLFRELVHDTSHISSKMKSLLIRESLECYHDNGPVKLDCVKNVWRDFFLIDDLISLYNANIAKKYHEGCGDRKYYKLMYLYDVNMIAIQCFLYQRKQPLLSLPIFVITMPHISLK